MALKAGMVAVVVAGLAATVVTAAPRSASSGEADTVETLAGPRLCAGTGMADPASRAVRSVAMDGGGRLFLDSGRAEDAVVVRVAANAMAVVLHHIDSSGSGTSRLAADEAGGVLVAAGARVDWVEHDGKRSTIAGDVTSEPGGVAAGDGGPARDARFRRLKSVASDESGNVYVADELDPSAGTVRIRFINRGEQAVVVYPGTPMEVTVQAGHIATIAGAAGPVARGDGGPAASATLRGEPPALAVAGERLYLASSVANAAPPSVGVRVVNLSGQEIVTHGVPVPAAGIETVAGGGLPGFDGDGGPARRGRFTRLPAIAADSSGALYLADADNHRIRKVDQEGVLTTLAGSGPVGRGRGGYNGNNRPATHARLNRPSGVTVDVDGRVYVADELNGQVRMIDERGLIHAAPGNGLVLTWMCEDEETVGPPTQNRPVSLAVDERGAVYFAAVSLREIYRRDPSSGAVSPAIGVDRRPPSCPPGARCPIGHSKGVKEVSFARPAAVATDGRGGVYVLDAPGGRLWLANLGSRPLAAHGQAVAPGLVTTVATDALSPDARSASLARDAGGDVYVADGARVVRIDGTGKTTTVVEKAERDRWGRPVSGACCDTPYALASAGAGVVYVSDAAGRRVWVLNRGSEPVTVHGHRVAAGGEALVAGSGEEGFGGDGGPAVEAQFQVPGRIAVDGEGNLYVTDQAEDTVRRVDASGTISTVVGIGSPGFNGDGLRGALTALMGPGALAVDNCGNVLIADTLNFRVRRWNRPGPCAAPSTGANESDARGGGGAGGARTALTGVAGLVALSAICGGLALAIRSRRPHLL